eukprot:TRINITY_DN8395_c0_g3_i1.p2 TRINITY_DN8395_c0_g3~~TRINITY_DN8395_c0_g3_i1.p2  ORF type:complete len:173 (-),score=44.46 TRINITY_DN8395_c0_g3_i1:111-629(-)
MKTLVEMGFSETFSRTALKLSNNNIDTAVELYPCVASLSLASGNLPAPSAIPAELGQYKMVILVRMDLKMGIGKIAAQVGHAVLGAYKDSQQKNPIKVAHWEQNGCAKVVLKVKDETELKEIVEGVRKDGIAAHLVQDAGRTQVEPGTLTVCGIGPDAVPLIDKHTGKLQLL